MVLSSLIAADILLESLSTIADVEYQEMSVAARLDCVAGRRPVLYLDETASEEDRCRAMSETLLALSFGPHAAVSARQLPLLRSVS